MIHAASNHGASDAGDQESSGHHRGGLTTGVSRGDGTLTDDRYWVDFWKAKPPTIMDSRGHVRDFVREELVRLLGRWVEPGSRWVEIGCANSTFLYDFPRNLRATLDGVDIAESALEATRAAVGSHGITPHLSLHDFRDIPELERHAYDGVLSYGFAEHFNNCAQVHETLSGYLKPGGVVATIVPNMTGLPGTLQQWFDERTFLTHNVLTQATLRGALEDSGFLVDFCEPIIALNLGVVNTSSLAPPTRAITNAVFVGLGRALAALQIATGRRISASHWRAPYLLAVGHRK